MTQTNRSKIKCLAVAGPTASGKTACAIALALRFDGEVIGADSMQIYKGMDIGTAKPAKEEMQGVPHHLIGVIDRSEDFSVARYARLCRQKIEEVAARGRLPILAGGTGLYLSSVIDNIQFAQVGSDEKLREELRQKGREEGVQALLLELASFDPQSAQRLQEGDLKRIVRAIEVYRLSGKTMTQLNEESRSQPSPYDFLALGLGFHDRNILYDRINRRVDQMMEQGLLEEAKALLEQPSHNTAMQAIGYKELRPYLEGKCSLSQAVECIKQETRRYAKRQLTWFRRMESILWLYGDEAVPVAQQAVAAAGAFLKERKGREQ